ncbi:MAG TPA: lipid II flippase MurJ, partial [Actinomycetaceae bacterium]|nr:lipid II flippase MurJ [Actinomycetaceae bacterium]
MTTTAGTGGGLFAAFTKMFSGTLVSRILGMVRLLVLLAALGSMGAADAFNVANGLPNTLYNLLAGGVMNAILVPQIVRALRRDDGGAEYTNKLITLTGLILFVATVILTVAAPLLVMLYAGQMDPAWRGVAVAFALWCIPEVLFYGLYTLFGNILNARGSFGPYMWAPVLNNVVAIAGLAVYIWVYGTAASGAGAHPSEWDGARIALVGGFALAGVMSQALVLIIPLRRSGVRFRPDFKFRGAGLSGASRMAKWAFAALAVGQVGFLMLSNVANAANGVATPLREAGDPAYLTIPTITAYTATFAVYMLPQSLVTTSLVTAVFTSMSAKAAAGDGAGVRDDMSQSIRVLGVFTVFMGAGMMVLALPIVQSILFTTESGAEPAFAAVLAALAFGIPAQAVWTVVQRVSFAYEDAKTLTGIQVPMSLVIVVFGLFAVFVLPPQWWLVVTAFSSTLGQYLGGVLGFLALRKKLPSLDGSRILRTYLRLALAMIPAALAGWGVLTLWDPYTEGGGMGQILGALARLFAVGILMLAIYVTLLRAFKVDELDDLISPFKRLFGRLRGGRPATPASPPTMPASPPTIGGKGESGESAGATGPREEPDGDGGLPAGNGGKEKALQASSTRVMLAGRFRLDKRTDTLETGAEVWTGRDTVLDRAVSVVAVPNVEGSNIAFDLLDSARRASLVEDNRFARLVAIAEGEIAGAPVAYVVSENPPGERLTAFEGSFDDGAARAVVGETAAALEAARRRGVQHAALTPALVHLSDEGIAISGLAYFAVATGQLVDNSDPVEASLERSQSDADALAGLYSFLTGGRQAPQLADAANAGAVMRALTPWEEISIPPASSSWRGSGPPPPPSTGANRWSSAAGTAGATRAADYAGAAGTASAASAARTAGAAGATRTLSSAADSGSGDTPPPPPP